MKIALCVLIMLCAMPLYAQEDYLLGSSSIEHGGYGALVTKFTSINGRFGLVMGVRGGWIIDHTFAVGIAGYGLVSNVKANAPGPNGEPYVGLGYGGLDLEYIYRSNDLVHASIHTLIGAGAVGFRNNIWAHAGGRPEGVWDPHWTTAWDRNWEYENDPWPHNYNVFFIVEPGANVDVNITRWFRTSFGATFRLVSGVSSAASSNRDLSGPSGSVAFRFGSF